MAKSVKSSRKSQLTRPIGVGIRIEERAPDADCAYHLRMLFNKPCDILFSDPGFDLDYMPPRVINELSTMIGIGMVIPYSKSEIVEI